MSRQFQIRYERTNHNKGDHEKNSVLEYVVALSERQPFKKLKGYSLRKQIISLGFFKGCLPDVKDFVDNNDLGRFNLHELF